MEKSRFLFFAMLAAVLMLSFTLTGDKDAKTILSELDKKAAPNSLGKSEAKAG